MGEFVLGAIATLLGAAAAFASAWYFERRRERVAQLAVATHEAREVRRAARLVWEELIQNASDVEGAYEDSVWWANPPSDLLSANWKEYRSTLAVTIEDDDDWDIIV